MNKKSRKKQRPFRFLYHGTCATKLAPILEQGLQPRCVHGGPSNFSGKVESKPEYVYLTDAWPVYYGVNVADGDEFAVLRVLVYEDEMLPDEDFLALLKDMTDREQRKAKFRAGDREGGKRRKTAHDFIAESHPSERPDLALHSLEHLGTVAVSSVPRDRIIDHYVMSVMDFGYLTHLGADSNPTMNALIAGLREHSREKYKRLLGRLFEVGWEELKREIEAESEQLRKQFDALRVRKEEE